ncbi:MAG: hypothetical protein PVF56_06695 [Desulfobacterales bacterium]|jgi:hypothetical protein
METFTAARAFVVNPDYDEERRASLRKLDLSSIDPPIVEIVKGFAWLSYCFTLQSCYGHFLYAGQIDTHNTEPLPLGESIDNIEYRIAYLALCLEDSPAGRDLFDELGEITSVDPDYLQFGSADWFWERHLNSYALQVEPKNRMTRDRCHIDYQEALQVEKVRNRFFDELTILLQKRLRAEFN